MSGFVESELVCCFFASKAGKIVNLYFVEKGGSTPGIQSKKVKKTKYSAREKVGRGRNCWAVAKFVWTFEEKERKGPYFLKGDHQEITHFS